MASSLRHGAYSNKLSDNKNICSYHLNNVMHTAGRDDEYILLLFAIMFCIIQRVP